MKTHWIKPGFEFIFSLGLIAIMTLPLLVFAQGTKNMEIRITNGDTVINGKNIKELSPADRKAALKDIENIGSPDNAGRHRVFIRKRGVSDTGSHKIIIEDRRIGNDGMDNEMAEQFRMPNDSAVKFFKFKMNRKGGKDSVFTFNYKMNTDPGNRFFDERNGDFDFRMRNPRMAFGRHRNAQSFDYTNTGSDGIATHVSFHVTDPSPEKLKAMTGNEKSSLEISDLNLVPEFSTGKTLLLFGLASKAVAEVRLTDNEGKLIWTDKAVNGKFNRSFVLGLNGVYFLQVKQGGKIAVKRILKEE